MKLPSQIFNVLVIGILLSQLAACGPVSETWTLVQIVTQGDHTDEFTDTVTVQNCGIVQPKTVTCSAGTTNDLSLGGGVEVGEGAKVSVDVSKSLGIGRESGENVNLEAPPNGYVYIYTVNKEYRVTSGNVIAQSSGGKQQTVNYNFNASCSLQVTSRKQVDCSELNKNPEPFNLPGEIWETSIQESHVYQRHVISDKELVGFSLEADVKINDNSPEYHGLMFDLQTNERNFYSFRVTSDGYFAFDVWQDNPDHSFSRVLGPSNSSAINKGTGQINRLKVVVSGGRFNLFINGQEVGAITDTTYSSGRVGFVSCTCDGAPNSSATFSNAVILEYP